MARKQSDEGKPMDSPSFRIPSTEELILLAVAEWGYPIEKALNQHFTANGLKVMQQALTWAGLWNELNRSSLYREVYNATIEQWYGVLIAMCRKEHPLIDAPGLRDPCMYATYSAFGLTESGWSLVESLRKDFPDLQKTFAK